MRKFKVEIILEVFDENESEVETQIEEKLNEVTCFTIKDITVIETTSGNMR